MRLIFFEIATQKFGRASLIQYKILLTPSAPRTRIPPQFRGNRFKSDFSIKIDNLYAICSVDNWKIPITKVFKSLSYRKPYGDPEWSRVLEIAIEVWFWLIFVFIL